MSRKDDLKYGVNYQACQMPSLCAPMGGRFRPSNINVFLAQQKVVSTFGMTGGVRKTLTDALAPPPEPGK